MTIDFLSVKTSIDDGLFWLERMFGWFDLVVLQKVFYLLSINLLVIGTIEFFKNRKKRKKFHGMSALEKTVKTVDLALDPELKGEEIGHLLLVIKKGGKSMLDYLKSMSKAQWISIAVMIVSIVLGIICVTVPAVGQYEEIIYTVGSTFFGSAFVGAFAKGKSAATSTISSHKSTIKTLKKKLSELNVKYADIIELSENIKSYGGTMTTEESTKYSTYNTQKNSIETKIKAEENKIAAEKAAKQSSTISTTTTKK